MGEEYGRSPASQGRSGGPSDPSPQAVSAVPAPATNAASFTRGPWVVCKDSAYVDGSDGKPVAYCRDPERRPSDMVANARLIAAAPDLYAALELFAQLKVPAKPEGNAGFYSIPFERIARAQAALAKARGERLSSMDAKVADNG